MVTPIIKIRNLTYHYPNSKKPAVNNVSFNVYKGQWLSLIGLNGSGKSTLVKLIDGLLTNFKGHIIVDQMSVSSKDLLKIRSKIGIVFQNPQDQFVGTTVKDEIAFGLENQQIPSDRIRELIKWALKVVGMVGYQDNLIDDLSGGQQQRIAIADVIVMKPKILILDEAISMLNPQGRIQILQLIENLKYKLHLTVIDITHDVNECRYAQKIMVMKNGRILMKGSPEQVFNNGKQLKKLRLGIPDADQLKDLLRQRGLSIPDRHFSETGMLLSLHKLFFKR